MAGAPFARRGGKVLNHSQRTSGIGLGKGVANRRRTRMMPRDTIMGITKGDLRRLARRGGVKRISADVYQTARVYLSEFLRDVISEVRRLTLGVEGLL